MEGREIRGNVGLHNEKKPHGGTSAMVACVALVCHDIRMVKGWRCGRADDKDATQIFHGKAFL